MAAAREDADVETSSEGYARRFAGPVGHFFLERQAQATIALLRPFPGASVLDVGGGHGQVTGPLVEAGYEVTVLGSDVSCEARVREWTGSGRARFVSSDLLAPPLPDRSFDVVLSYRLLPHVARWPDLVAALCRLARRAVVVDYPTRRSVNAVADLFFGLKKGVEGNTRPFTVFSDAEVERAFAGTDSRPPVAGRSSSSRWPSTGRSGRRGSHGDSRAWPRGSASRGPWDPPSSSGWSVVAEPGSAREWAVALFRRSVLKQRKLAEVAEMLGPTAGLRCLDLGSDNGVVSLLLRERGGDWASGDLTEEAVSSIRSLVGEDVHLVRGDRLPFADATFDRVAVVDMLEHVPDEAAFAAELARVTKPGGLLVVNTPHLKRTLLRRLRHALGQTDEKHGHLRPGYTPRAAAASCSRPPSRSSAIAPTRASFPRRWTLPSTGGWSGWGRSPRPRGWW